MSENLLLHTCCAPCLTTCLFVLKGILPWRKALVSAPDFNISVYFDNPNIDSLEEFDKRKSVLGVFLEKTAGEIGSVPVIPDRSSERRMEWLAMAEVYPDEPEKGVRCRLCYAFRLEETFRAAAERGFNAVATTLTLSPLKDSDAVNEAGIALSKKYPVRYIESDFKKNGGFQKSIEFCRNYEIYRQNYCGCVFSKKHLIKR